MFGWVPYQIWIFMGITGVISAICIFLSNKYSIRIRVAFLMAGLGMPVVVIKESVKNKIIEPIFSNYAMNYLSWISLGLLLCAFSLLFRDYYLKIKRANDVEALKDFKKTMIKIFAPLLISTIIIFLILAYSRL